MKQAAGLLSASYHGLLHGLLFELKDEVIVVLQH
jgi:hypothetical protein